MHWLRARARFERWKEEWDLTSHEMGWTVNFFARKASTWLGWAEKAHSQNNWGHECYARRQHAFWMTMKQNAIHSFQRAIQIVTKDALAQIPGLQSDIEMEGRADSEAMASPNDG